MCNSMRNDPSYLIREFTHLLQNMVHLSFIPSGISFLSSLFLEENPKCNGDRSVFQLPVGLRLRVVQTLQSRPCLCSAGPAICQCPATCLMMAQCCREGGGAKGCPLTGSKGHDASQLLSSIFHSINFHWVPATYKV